MICSIHGHEVNLTPAQFRQMQRLMMRGPLGIDPGVLAARTGIPELAARRSRPTAGRMSKAHPVERDPFLRRLLGR
jgi:hypothetical protein